MANKLIRPLSDIRLRDWDSGRLNELRLAVEKLETAANKSLAASSKQSDKRAFNDQIPFPINVVVNPGFKQLTLDIGAVPGLGNHPIRQLLFYEIQYDSSPAFPDPVTLTSPQRHIAIAGFAPGETVSVRIRVVSTLNEVGPWSSVLTVTLARAPIQITQLNNLIRISVNGGIRLTKPIGQWQRVLEAVYQPVDARSSLNCHIAMATPHFDVNERVGTGAVRRTFRGGPGFVQFRYQVGSLNVFTNQFELFPVGDRCLLSARPGYAHVSTTVGRNDILTPSVMCSLPSPWFDPIAGVNCKIIIEAAKLPGSEWNGPDKSKSMHTSDPLIFLRNPMVLESLRAV